jgi:hypothetical protein
MAKGGKVGGGKGVGVVGGKGSTGKGGGGKGKNGGVCPPGQVPFCLDEPDYQAATSAFNSAIVSGGSDGCITGQRRVCLETQAAFNLLFALSQGLGLGGGTKKKKGKGTKGK